MAGQRPQVAIVGLDGATWEEIRPQAARGELPHLARLTEDGLSGELRSTIPPITSSAWTTLFTGADPADHGVIDMETFDEGLRRWRSVFLSDCRREPFWRSLNRAGLSVGLLGVPFTYPPARLNGWSISGIMGSPEYDRTMFSPPELHAELTAALGPMSLVPPNVVGRGQDVRTLEAQAKWLRGASEYLLQHHPVDVFMVVENYTDHTQHGYMLSRRSKGGETADIIALAYRLADDLVGAVQAAAPDTPLLVLSDHGSGPTLGAINTSRLNLQRGEIPTEPAPVTLVLPQAPRSAGARVRARVGPAARRLWVRLGSRRAAWLLRGPRALAARLAGAPRRSATLIRWVGSYGVAYWDPLADLDGLELSRLGVRVREALADLRFPGEDRRLFAAVRNGTELYGPDGRRPFVVAEPPPGFLLLPLGQDAPLVVGPEQIVRYRPLNMSCEGCHRMEGIFLANASARQALGSPPREIRQVLAGVRRILGLPGAADASDDWTEAEGASPLPMDREDVERVEQRLRDLGYL